MRPLEEFIKPTQEELFKKLKDMFVGKTSSCKNSYVLVHGEALIMLVAHLDTVHKEPVRQICKTSNGTILMSPQGIGGDDRCGVYALVTVYERSNIKPWLLFTCDEEIGGVGVKQFCIKHQKGKLPKELDDLKLIVEIDRKGNNDAVYYDCENPEFEDYITSKGFKTDFGSFSDISYVAPELKTAAVNLSSGYYNAHTLHEYIHRKQLNATVRKVVEIVADCAKPDFPKYEYIEAVRSFRGRYGYYGGWNDDFSDWSAKPPLSKEDDGEPNLDDVPDEIIEEYIALLDFYTTEELDNIRKEHGDAAITMLCQSEFGDDYYEMFGYEDEQEDEG